MKYLKLYKLFESVSIQDIYSEVAEIVDDINFDLNETTRKISYKYLTLNDYSKNWIVDLLLIGDDYKDQIITINSGTGVSPNLLMSKLKRACYYLSSKENLDLDVDYILDTYVVSSKKIIALLSWIYHFEAKDISTKFTTLDIQTKDIDMAKSWNYLVDMGFIFRIMKWYSECGNRNGGVFVYVINKEKNEFLDKILVFRFERGDIDDSILYDADIYFDKINQSQKNIPLPTLIENSDKNFNRVEDFDISFNLADDKSSYQNFYKILVGKTIHFFKIEKMSLLNQISGLLEDINEFFMVEEISVHLETIENPKAGSVQFVILGESFDEDQIFTIYVDDKLNIYINSLKEKDKSSLEGLIHDIFLKKSEKVK